MAQDDIEVVMYKILKYLYECMKAGKRPRAEDVCYDCQMFTINEKYWYQIMNELIDNGYIKGFSKVITKGGETIQMLDNAGITLKGRDYMRDNSGMQEAKNIVGKAFEIVLESIINALLPG